MGNYFGKTFLVIPFGNLLRETHLGSESWQGPLTTISKTLLDNYLGKPSWGTPWKPFFEFSWKCVGNLSLKLRLGIYLGSISGNLLENSFLDISKGIIRQFLGGTLVGNSLGHLIANLENAMGNFSQATLWWIRPENVSSKIILEKTLKETQQKPKMELRNGSKLNITLWARCAFRNDMADIACTYTRDEMKNLVTGVLARTPLPTSPQLLIFWWPQKHHSAPT